MDRQKLVEEFPAGDIDGVSTADSISRISAIDDPEEPGYDAGDRARTATNSYSSDTASFIEPYFYGKRREAVYALDGGEESELSTALSPDISTILSVGDLTMTAVSPVQSPTTAISPAPAAPVVHPAVRRAIGVVLNASYDVQGLYSILHPKLVKLEEQVRYVDLTRTVAPQELFQGKKQYQALQKQLNKYVHLFDGGVLINFMSLAGTTAYTVLDDALDHDHRRHQEDGGNPQQRRLEDFVAR